MSGPSLASALDNADVALTIAKHGARTRKDVKVFEGLRSDEFSSLKEGALEIFSVVKGQLANFVQSSEGLTRALDELSKLHTFAAIAIIPFKVALALELKRRDNDKKVVTLFIQMSDMMATLRLLEPIKPAELGSKGLEQRMSNRLSAAASAIEKCSHETDEYYKMKFISKLIKSTKWQEKFTDFAQKFAKFRTDFEADLAIYTGTGVQAIHRAVGNMDEKISTLMKQVFDGFASPDEQELLKFIRSKGGPDKFINDDKLLKDLIQKHEKQQPQNCQSCDQTRPCKASFDQSILAFENMKKELQSDLDVILAESKTFFCQKFEEQKHQIAEVKIAIRRESDRILDQLLSGAHDRILDKVVYAIWIEMGWKGSTKARHLVLALRDFYVEQLQHTPSSPIPKAIIKGASTEPQSIEDKDNAKVEEISHKLVNTPTAFTPEDAWAMGLFGRSHLSPLMEAVDPDCSGFVTIKEINDFTSSRPPDWSLPQWILYWTIGFEVTVRQYCYRIRALLSEFHTIYHSLIPGNAGFFSSIMEVIQLLEYVVAGVHTFEVDGKQDEYQNPRFQEYASGLEKQLEKRLRSFEYHIDEKITLSLVIGPRRLEECFLPLYYLLLRNILRITKKGQTRLLQFSECYHTLISFNTLWEAGWDHTVSLKGVFKLRNVPVKDEFRRYAYGMYYYMVASEEFDKDSSYFEMPDSDCDPLVYVGEDDDEDDEDDTHSIVDSTNTNHNINSLDYGGYEEMEPPSEGISEPSGLVGTWSGFYYHGFSTSTHIDGFITFQINTLDDQGLFTGKGSDALLDFNIYGTLKGKSITFSRENQMFGERTGLKWVYSGEVNEALDTIIGNFSKLEDQASPDTRLSEREPIENKPRSLWKLALNATMHQLDEGKTTFDGMFTVQKKSARPSEREFVENKPRSLWKLALNAVIHQLATRTLRWSVLKKRRDQRRRFIELLKEHQAVGLESDSDVAELKTLQSTLSNADVRLYLTLTAFEQAREVIHKNAICDICHTSPLKTTRFECLDCSAGYYAKNAIGICLNCIHKTCTITREEGTVQLKHLPIHPLLQIRRPLLLRPTYSMRENALDIIQDVPPDPDAPDATAVRCTDCDKGIRRPYWACCECECQDIYVCMDCNSKIEQRHPWLYERKQVPTTTIVDLPNAKHHWSHSLVLCVPFGTQAPPVTIEGRITILEEKLQEQLEQGKYLETRLERLEQLLLRLAEGTS